LSIEIYDNGFLIFIVFFANNWKLD